MVADRSVPILRIGRPLILPLALGAFVFAAYGATLRFPFVQDDWAWIARFRTEPAGSIIASIFSIKGSLFFRPLPALYFYSMYSAFGGNPLPFHIVGLALLAANAWLVARIVRVVTTDDVVSVASGFVFAAGAAVHLETILWTVGINDLGGMLFFFLSMLLFLSGRRAVSVVAFAAGCLFKEEVLILPFVLLAYVLIQRHGARRTERAALGRLWPMLAAFAIIACVKLLGRSFATLPEAHPYALRLQGTQILHSLFLYLAWMSQCFDALLSDSGTTIKVVLNDMLLLLLFAVWIASWRPEQARIDETAGEPGTSAAPSRIRGAAFPIEGPIEVLRFLLLWLAVPLAPVILLVNHTYRYYAAYSLAAFAAIVFVSTRLLFGSTGRGGRLGGRVIIALAACAAILSFYQTQVVLHEGLRQVTLVDGTNYLVRRAEIVRMVREGLERELPSPPRGATILLGDTDLGAFDGDAGPRAWYGDPEISVYRLEDVGADQNGLFVHRPPKELAHPYEKAGPGRIYIDPAKTFAFRLDESGLHPAESPLAR